MSQKYFQIIQPVHVHLKTDNVDYFKTPPYFFLHIFTIASSSRREKCCQMLQTLFSVFQYSRNTGWNKKNGEVNKLNMEANKNRKCRLRKWLQNEEVNIGNLWKREQALQLIGLNGVEILDNRDGGTGAGGPGRTHVSPTPLFWQISTPYLN